MYFSKRFAYPCRYLDMIPRFARPKPQLCMTSNAVMKELYQTWNCLLTELNQDWLNPNHLEEFAVAVHNRGAVLDNCWFFFLWDCEAHLPTRTKPKVLIQWSQKSSCNKVSIYCSTQWSCCQPVWACRGKET